MICFLCWLVGGLVAVVGLIGLSVAGLATAKSESGGLE